MGIEPAPGPGLPAPGGPTAAARATAVDPLRHDTGDSVRGQAMAAARAAFPAWHRMDPLQRGRLLNCLLALAQRTR